MESKKTPLSVNIIGWFYIACALSVIIYSLIKSFKLLFFHNTFQVTGISYIIISRLAQVIIPVFVIIISIQFLKLRNWAKIIIEILSWLSLLFAGLFWIVVLLVMNVSLSNLKYKQPFNYFYPFAILITIVSIMASIIPFVLIIKTLRENIIRELFEIEEK